jgi:hypothetical protein
VKNIARLVLFFSLTFAALFIFSAAPRYLHLWMGGVRLLPARPQMALPEFIAAARWALSLTVYFSLLFGLSYAARLNTGPFGAGKRRLSAPSAMLCLFILALAFSTGITLGLDRLGAMVPAPGLSRPLGGPGLLLTQGDTTIALLRGPAESQGSRVVAMPGRSLVYQEQPLGPNNTVLSLPPVPFRDEAPWFLRSLAIDFSLTGRRFVARLEEGLVSFLISAGALIFLLVSLGFILKVSNWPLANLSLGCLAFRGILAAETFLNSPEIQDLFAEFLENRLPLSYTVPLIFSVFGVMINLYTFLVFLARRRTDEEI